MKQVYLIIVAWLLVGCHRPPVFLQAEEVQLSKPEVNVEQVFFTDSTLIKVRSQQPGTRIKYSLERPQRLNTNGPLVLRETTKLEVSSEGPNYRSSDSLRLEVFKVKAIKNITIRHSAAAAPYDGEPATVLIDRQKAGKDFRSGGWLGFQESTVRLEIDLPSQAQISGLVLSCLENQVAWIFAPQRLLIRYYDEHDYEIFRQETFYAAGNQLTESRFHYFNSEDAGRSAPAKVAMATINPRRITLDIHNLPGIPDWHPGKGNPPWLFIDEIALF